VKGQYLCAGWFAGIRLCCFGGVSSVWTSTGHGRCSDSCIIREIL